jgi:hypothetical protein
VAIDKSMKKDPFQSFRYRELEESRKKLTTEMLICKIPRIDMDLWIEVCCGTLDAEDT